MNISSVLWLIGCALFGFGSTLDLGTKLGLLFMIGSIRFHQITKDKE